MKRRPAPALILALLAACTGAPGLHAGERASECRPGEVGIFIPAFGGLPAGEKLPGDGGGEASDRILGLQVATVLNLQIWQTLRRADGAGGSFGRGVVVWDPEPLAEPGFTVAEKEARRRGCQLALWGRAWRYGEDILAQTYLSILDDPILWRSRVEIDSGPQSLEIGFPRRRYEFAPIVLRPEVVERFSRPSALTLSRNRDGSEPLGGLGPEFFALEQHRDLARVVSGGRAGWVRLPRLSDERTEVVDFVGGIVRVLRGDWSGARDLLTDVIDNPSTPGSLVVDSLILQGVAIERLGANGWAMIARAYEHNPHSRITARYGLMQRLTSLAERGAGGGGDTAAERQALERALADTRHLFAADDPWRLAAQRALASRP